MGAFGRVCAGGGAQPLSAEPKATREARGARRRRAGCARWLRLAGGGGESKTAIPGAGTAAGITGGVFWKVCAGGGAQPLSAEPKATREARGARRRRAGCARWLRLAGIGGESKTAIPGAGTAAVIYGR